MKYLQLLTLTLVVVVRADNVAAEDVESRPSYKNVILMVGDGMGLAQISSARLQKGRLWLEAADHYGFSFTHSFDNFVTDSAASATALASGYLVPNARVATDPEGKPIRTILEIAQEMGKKTGLVATSRITHATPAAFASHVLMRSDEDLVAEHLSKSGVDVLLGGGWDKFLPRRQVDLDGDEDSSGKIHGNRADGRDLIREMTKNDYVFVRTAAELHSIAGAKRTLGLFYAGPMLKVTEGRSPSLSAMTHYALRTLSDAPEGFFLMVEGSQIDFGGHANDLDYVITETTDFDESIGEVFRFLNDHGLQEETLVLITGDHETGGLSLNPHPRLPLSYQPKWTTDGHTGVAVPVFSYGAGSANFKGIQTHSDIGRKLIEGMTGWTIDWEYPGSQR